MKAPALETLIEQGDPSADARAFRRCLGSFATGVTVMTAVAGPDRVGITVNSFSSLSLEPPLILWSINKTSRSFRTFISADYFAVNILGQDQILLSQLFSSAEIDKFAKTRWSAGAHGAPLLDGVKASLECKRESIYEGGDHAIITGRVSRFATFQGEPLLFSQGRYGIAEDHPSLKEDKIPDANGDGGALDQWSLISLLFRAYHDISAGFEDHRRAEGLSRAQARVLAALYEVPRQTIDELAGITFLGKRDTDDAVADLVAKALATRSADETLELSLAGKVRRKAVRARAEDFENEQLTGLSIADAIVAKRFLAALIARSEQEAGDGLKSPGRSINA